MQFTPFPRFQSSNLECVISCVNFCHFSTQTHFINFLLKSRHEIFQLIPFPKSRHVIHHMIRSLPSGVPTNPKANQTNSWDGMTTSVSNVATSPLALGDRTMSLTPSIYEIMIPNPYLHRVSMVSHWKQDWWMFQLWLVPFPCIVRFSSQRISNAELWRLYYCKLEQAVGNALELMVILRCLNVHVKSLQRSNGDYSPDVHKTTYTMMTLFKHLHSPEFCIT